MITIEYHTLEEREAIIAQYTGQGCILIEEADIVIDNIGTRRKTLTFQAPPSPEEVHEQMRTARQEAFTKESDPIYIGALTDGATMAAARALVAPIKQAIRERYPYPEGEV